jgi:two-component system, response regulator PdtaR
MDFQKPSRKVMVVSSSEKGAEFVTKLLDPTRYDSVTIVKNAGEERRSLINGSFDTMIINTPLTDEFGHELALYAADNSVSGIILIVKSQIFDEISSRVESSGVITVAKPLSVGIFHQTLAMVYATQERIRGMKKENDNLRSKIDELKIINRAKCVLIEYLNMSEPAAHRYIEKQAMDMRATKFQVAEKILKMYED